VLIDARTIPEGTTIEVDLCIIGGGPAGISVALPFIDSSTKVAIIESGGLDFDETTQELAEATNSGHDYFPIKETRIRAFGGSTLSWGGISAPLDTIDFENDRGYRAADGRFRGKTWSHTTRRQKVSRM